MKALSEFYRRTWTLSVPLTLFIVACPFLPKEYVMFLSNFGTPAIVLLNIVYIVTWQAPKHWPGVSWPQRLVRLLTFHR